MENRRAERWSRREFLGGLTLVGTVGVLGLRPGRGTAEPPPETTRLRLTQTWSICRAPQHLAEEFLPGEGFTHVQYVKLGGTIQTAQVLASGQADLSMQFVGPTILQIDAGDPALLLAGVQVGCFELFGTDRVRAIRDLKGKTVCVGNLRGSDHTFLAAMLAYVGLDPRTDIHWVTEPRPEAALQLFAEGKLDALVAVPPQAQELRAKQIGHVVGNSMMDRPWSQHFCCLVAGNEAFVRKHPVATKRALRAILKAANVCAREPERVARFLVDKGYTKRYDYAVEALKEMPYDKWGEYDPEATVRFHALRLHEVGMIKSSPQKIIAQGTDWRFLNELKKEMKG